MMRGADGRKTWRNEHKNHELIAGLLKRLLIYSTSNSPWKAVTVGRGRLCDYRRCESHAPQTIRD